MSGIGIDELVGLAYEAALYPDGWETFLRALVRGFDAGDDAALLIAYPDELPWSVTTVAPEFMATYREHFHSIDPGWKLLPEPGGCSTILAEAERGALRLDRDPFMNDWLYPQGVLDGINAVIDETAAGELSRIAVLRPRSSGPVDPANLELMNRLMPHLQRSLRIHRRLRPDAGPDALAGWFLDAIGHAVFLLDERLRVVGLNRSAEAMMSVADPDLRVSNGRLRCRRRDDSSRLAAMVSRAMAAAKGRGVPGGDYMALPRPSPLASLAVYVCSVRPDVRPGSPSEPLVLVSVTNPDLHFDPPEAALQAVFGLTAAEARIAVLLCRGLSIKQIAEKLTRSPNTIRNQLKAIFAKTGTASQTSLVSMMVRWIPMPME